MCEVGGEWGERAWRREGGEWRVWRVHLCDCAQRRLDSAALTTSSTLAPTTLLAQRLSRSRSSTATAAAGACRRWRWGEEGEEEWGRWGERRVGAAATRAGMVRVVVEAERAEAAGWRVEGREGLCEGQGRRGGGRVCQCLAWAVAAGSSCLAWAVAAHLGPSTRVATMEASERRRWRCGKRGRRVERRKGGGGCVGRRLVVGKGGRGWGSGEWRRVVSGGGGEWWEGWHTW